MTGLERYRRALLGERTDFPPRTPILMQFAARHIGRTYGDFVADHSVLVEANCRCADDFGMDQVSSISDPYRETAGFGGEVRIERDGPSCLPLLADGIDLSRLQKPDPYSSPRMKDRLDAIRSFRQRAGGRLSILGWVEGAAAEAADLRGPEQFFMDLIEDPVAIGGLMDVCLQTAIEFARAQVEAGADTIGIGDAVASQVSPRLYESLILPRQRLLIQAIRDTGAFVRVHICGNITHLLPGLATTALHAIDVDSMVDLARVRGTLGPAVLIGANLDPVNSVMLGTPESIRDGLNRAWRECGSPFAANAGCEIPSETPPANLAALCGPLTTPPTTAAPRPPGSGGV